MKQFVLPLFLVFIELSVLGQNYNRPVPSGIFPYEAEINQSFTGDYFLMSNLKLFMNPGDPGYVYPYVCILDENGYIAWYYKNTSPICIDFKYIPQTNNYLFTRRIQGSPKTIVLNEQFESVDTLNTLDTRDVHDIQLADNGNWLITTAYFDTMDLSSQTFNGTQGSVETIVKGFGYEEQTANGSYVQSWNSNDYVQVSETYDYWGYSAANFDYCHGNAIEEDVDGDLLLSYRHLNSIHKIDRNSGNIIWRLGGEMSDFTFVNDGGFSGQHDVRVLANGNYSLFDNGNMSGISRSVIYQLDTVGWTATKVYEYIHPVGALSSAMGNFQVLADGRNVHGYGLTYRPDPNATITDLNQSIVSEFRFQDSVVTYRFLQAQLPFPERPIIECYFNGSNWELTVPGNYASIEWNNGETSSSISLNQTGEYQAWINYGIGMIGSLPITINDINNPCSIGVNELTNNEPLKYTLYDVQGRVINNPQPFTLYIKLYQSGKTEKFVISE